MRIPWIDLLPKINGSPPDGSKPLTLSYFFLQAKTSIEEVVAHMRPHNCNVMFLSRNFDKPSDSPLAKDTKEEFWYKTKYTSKGKSWFVECFTSTLSNFFFMEGVKANRRVSLEM